MFTRFCALLSKYCLFLAIAGLLTVVVCVQWMVFGRYVLNDTPTWVEPFVLMLMIYVTGLGVAVGVRDAGHIGLESIIILLPEGLRIKFEILVHVCVGTFGALMAYHGYIWMTIKWDDLIPILHAPVGMQYLPIMVSGVLIVIFCVEHVLALIQGKEVKPSWH
jgi:TRAP-type transport system small permease protein